MDADKEPARKGKAMELGYCTLACTGDNPLPFIVGGVVLLALIVLVYTLPIVKRFEYEGHA